ncbi:MAG TPA: hypothetical protein VES79_07055, partial [Solirubrobacteraceae bacterium]|nr:hypothetical protein [Solirubrobacteraceae bacterium]
MNLDYSRAARKLRIPAALWVLALTSTVFAPTASASTGAARVIVLERAGAGSGPEAAVRQLGGHVEREIGLVHGFVARVPWRGLGAL